MSGLPFSEAYTKARVRLRIAELLYDYHPNFRVSGLWCHSRIAIYCLGEKIFAELLQSLTTKPRMLAAAVALPDTINLYFA